MVSVVLDQGRVECSAAQVVDQNPPRFFIGHFMAELAPVPRVGERGGGRFVDDVDHVQPGDLPGVLRRLPAGIVEVVRNGDHGIGDRAQNPFAVLLELAQDQRRDEFRRDFMAVERPLVADIPHLPLDPLDDVFGIFHRRAVAVRPDHHMFVFGQQDQAGGFDIAVLVLDRNRFPLLVDLSQRRKGGSQVDSNGISG